MIVLNVEDYCHKCDQFSPATETNVMYGNGKVYMREVTVYCKDHERCRSIYENIMQTIDERKEDSNL